jgi:hypothetical protein
MSEFNYMPTPVEMSEAVEFVCRSLYIILALENRSDPERYY